MTGELRVALDEALSAGSPLLVWIPVSADMDPVRRLREAAGTWPLALLSSPSLPDRHARALWVQELETGIGWRADPADDWDELLEALPLDRPAVLAFDRVSGFLDTHKRWAAALGRFWNRIRAQGAPVALVLTDPDQALLARLREAGSPFRHPSETLRPELAGPPGRWLPLEQGDFGTLARRCPAWPADDVASGYAILGASDAVLRALDPGVRLATNVRRLLLDPDSPLFDRPLQRLRSAFQSPARYAAIVRALALGGREWGDFVTELSGEVAANALAPYVTRLRDLGQVEARRSLDAPVRSRRRRYRLSDPLEGFWWRFVAPLRSELLLGRLGPDEAWARTRDGLHGYLRAEAQRLVEQAVGRYGERLLGAPAREWGPLWGEGYDLPVAATLRGGAVCYGDLHWSDGAEPGSKATGMADALRHTRYGYGREARLRLLLTRGEPHPEDAALARRDPMFRLLTLDELVASARV